VSTRHATIERVDGHWRVTDLGSTNGTFVDGKQVGRSGATVRPNSRVTVGNVVLQLRAD
jgi:pSer/pThr/pTyr-binding forkhead associated (FHA) protein